MTIRRDDNPPLHFSQPLSDICRFCIALPCMDIMPLLAMPCSVLLLLKASGELKFCLLITSNRKGASCLESTMNKSALSISALLSQTLNSLCISPVFDIKGPIVSLGPTCHWSAMRGAQAGEAEVMVKLKRQWDSNGL